MDTATPTVSAEVVNITDEQIARRHLNKVRDGLATAIDNLDGRTNAHVDLIVKYRPSGLLTVDEISQAVGRERSYVDSVWSAFGDTTKGKQTRVTVDNPDPDAARGAYDLLVNSAVDLKRAAQMVSDARAERNRVVAMVYASKILGPSAIAAEVGIDRNHVLRLARRAGIMPMHRGKTKNQYTTK